jgi:tetratricopeptide (TPR) repeat protein
MSDFTRAEDVAPDDPMPPYEMGNLFFARKEYGKSIGYYDTALQADPNHAPSLARRGSAHLQRKDPALALADLQKAEKLDPTIPGIGRQVQLAKNQAVPAKKMATKASFKSLGGVIYWNRRHAAIRLPKGKSFTLRLRCRAGSVLLGQWQLSTTKRTCAPTRELIRWLRQRSP